MRPILNSSEGCSPSAAYALELRASAQEPLDMLGEPHAKQAIVDATEKMFNPSCSHAISQAFTLKVLNNASSGCVIRYQ